MAVIHLAAPTPSLTRLTYIDTLTQAPSGLLPSLALKEKVVSVLLAFTVEHAARVTGVSERRIRYWDRTGVLSPTLAHNATRRAAYNRIYSFRDLVGLRVLGQLRDRFDLPLQKLRRVGAWLKERYDEPWSSLRFYVVGRGRDADIVFRAPGADALVSATKPGQSVFPIELEPIAHEVEAAASQLTRRTPEQIGEIVQNRYVMSNAHVLAGTRIPTIAVWEFHEAGYGTDEILRQYPRLTPLDIDRAIAFEQKRHLKPAG